MWWWLNVLIEVEMIDMIDQCVDVLEMYIVYQDQFIEDMNVVILVQGEEIECLIWWLNKLMGWVGDFEEFMFVLEVKKLLYWQ